jgi:hypothetical protein
MGEGCAQTEHDDAQPVLEARVALHAEKVARRLGGEREAFGVDVSESRSGV